MRNMTDPAVVQNDTFLLFLKIHWYMRTSSSISHVFWVLWLALPYPLLLSVRYFSMFVRVSTKIHVICGSLMGFGSLALGAVSALLRPWTLATDNYFHTVLALTLTAVLLFVLIGGFILRRYQQNGGLAERPLQCWKISHKATSPWESRRSQATVRFYCALRCARVGMRSMPPTMYSICLRNSTASTMLFVSLWQSSASSSSDAYSRTCADSGWQDCQ